MSNLRFFTAREVFEAFPGAAGDMAGTYSGYGFEEHIVTTALHRTGLGGPPGTRPRCGAHHDSTWLGLQLDLVRQRGLVEEEFRHTDPSRVANPHDASLCRHVITL